MGDRIGSPVKTDKDVPLCSMAKTKDSPKKKSEGAVAKAKEEPKKLEISPLSLKPTPETPSTSQPVSVTSSPLSTPVDISPTSVASDRLDLMKDRDLPKLTVGDVINQLEEKISHMRKLDDFTGSDVTEDLAYVAQQTRYNSDMAVKRKIITKVVEFGMLSVFIKVFHSVHLVDYLSLASVKVSGVENNENSPGPPVVEENGPQLPPTPDANDKDVCKTKAQSDVKEKKELHQVHIHMPQRMSTTTESFRNFKAVITTVWNATEKSPFLCEECTKHGVVKLILNDLSEAHFGASELREPNRLYIVKGYLGILHNTIRYYGDAREAFREAGAVKVLQQYVKCNYLMVKTKAIMLLSYIINESENDIINANDRNIAFIVKMLQTAVDSDNHHAKKYGYWAVEVLAGLNRLAASDANKERILKKGALPLFMQLLLPGCSEEERLVSAQGLWILAFNEECKRMIREEAGCIEGLQMLGNRGQREEIRRTAKGALWVIQDKAAAPKPAPAAGSVKGKKEESQPHVMVSYQWSSRPTLLKIRDRLRAGGYKVFMDTDNMSGSPLEVMAESVDRASVVLMCMSQKYKDSPVCRTEAEYAQRLHKDIVPLRLQKGYNPDGWLGSMVGTKLCFDFSREENFEIMMANLVRELGPRGRVRVLDPMDGKRLAGLPSQVAVAGEPTCLAHIRNLVAGWSPEEVTKWLRDHGLGHVTDKLTGVNGELLLEIKKMYRQAPESFYTTLRNDLQFDFISTLKLTKALDRI